MFTLNHYTICFRKAVSITGDGTEAKKDEYRLLGLKKYHYLGMFLMVFFYQAINFSFNGCSNFFFFASAYKPFKLMKKIKMIHKKHIPKTLLHPHIKFKSSHHK